MENKNQPLDFGPQDNLNDLTRIDTVEFLVRGFLGDAFAVRYSDISPEAKLDWINKESARLGGVLLGDDPSFVIEKTWNSREGGIANSISRSYNVSGTVEELAAFPFYALTNAMMESEAMFADGNEDWTTTIDAAVQTAVRALTGLPNEQ